MNEKKESQRRTPAVLRILQQYSDPDHRISMPELISRLEERGIPTERKAVYASLRALKEEGFAVCFSRKQGLQGYWLPRTYTPAEILILRNAVYESASLSPHATKQLTDKLCSELSEAQAASLPEAEYFSGKTDNEQVLPSISLLLEAVRDCRSVLFRYYDLTVTKAKRYRKNAMQYHLLPVSILSYSGRYYCVCYSPVHKSFANYRIDKMSALQPAEQWESVPFDVHRWMESSFMMYRGDPGTITLKCDLSLTAIVFDQFGRDVLISAIEPDSFTVSIRSSVSPTLISWIIMFHTRVRVLHPVSLIEELQKTAETILKTYPHE